MTQSKQDRPLLNYWQVKGQGTRDGSTWVDTVWMGRAITERAALSKAIDRNLDAGFKFQREMKAKEVRA